ncbi:hypothetical protein FOVSG1_006217 [Fusarium oxysporum f. sp. vasinfectum]
MVATGQETTAEERKERRKLQNRLNQRARRQRVKESNPTSLELPYRIDRWRLAENSDILAHPSHRSNPSPQQPNADQQHSQTENCHPSQISTSEAASTSKVAPSRMFPKSTDAPQLSLPIDHTVIHLVTHNVCRGFVANKNILQYAANYINTIQHPPLPSELVAGCEVAVIRPGRQTVPPNLMPTQLQMNSPHPVWMDMLPFPTMRDNLIKQQYMFDHKSFLKDLIGDFVYLMSSPQRETFASKVGTQTYRLDDNGKLVRIENGLILWGAPHMQESWEASPHFLKKWAWVIQGCDELIDVSNRWRTARGELPVPKGGDGGMKAKIQ